jgi:SH3-like domain-containing protein
MSCSTSWKAKMISWFNRILFAAVAVTWLPGLAAADPVVRGEEHCVVNVYTDDRLNLRERPGDSARIVARKRHGECGIFVTGACRGTWCPVEDGHLLGWVHRRHISMISPALYCVTGVAPGDILNLRSWPSPQSRVLVGLPRRQCNIAFLPYATGRWQKIRVDGWQGWVSRRHLSGQ